MRLPNWYPIEVGAIRYYCPWHFLASGMVNCGFSTRQGGASEAPYDSLNLSLAVEDDPKRVIANRRAFAAALAVDLEPNRRPKPGPLEPCLSRNRERRGPWRARPLLRNRRYRCSHNRRPRFAPCATLRRLRLRLILRPGAPCHRGRSRWLEGYRGRSRDFDGRSHDPGVRH